MDVIRASSEKGTRGGDTRKERKERKSRRSGSSQQTETSEMKEGYTRLTSEVEDFYESSYRDYGRNEDVGYPYKSKVEGTGGSSEGISTREYWSDSATSESVDFSTTVEGRFTHEFLNHVHSFKL